MSLDYGLAIALPGYDVKTATDTQMILNSKFDTLKNYIIGITSILIPSGTNTQVHFNTTVTHSLGFVPAVSVYPNDGTNACTINNIQPEIYPLTRMIDRFEFSFDITSSIVKIFLVTSDAGGSGFPFGFDITINFKYYIFTQQMA